MQKVASAEADPLTKAMTQQQLDKHLEKMGLRYYGEWLQAKWEIISYVCHKAYTNLVTCK